MCARRLLAAPQPASAGATDARLGVRTRMLGLAVARGGARDAGQPHDRAARRRRHRTDARRPSRHEIPPGGSTHGLTVRSEASGCIPQAGDRARRSATRVAESVPATAAATYGRPRGNVVRAGGSCSTHVPPIVRVEHPGTEQRTSSGPCNRPPSRRTSSTSCRVTAATSGGEWRLSIPVSSCPQTLRSCGRSCVRTGDGGGSRSASRRPRRPKAHRTRYPRLSSQWSGVE